MRYFAGNAPQRAQTPFLSPLCSLSCFADVQNAEVRSWGKQRHVTVIPRAGGMAKVIYLQLSKL